MKESTKRIIKTVGFVILPIVLTLSFYGYNLYRYQFPKTSFNPSDNDTLACFRLSGLCNIEISIKGERGSLGFSPLLDTGDNASCFELESRAWDWLVERNPKYEHRWLPPFPKFDAFGGIDMLSEQLCLSYYIGKIYTKNNKNQTEYEINGIHMTKSNPYTGL